jgi:hypothetical protein
MIRPIHAAALVVLCVLGATTAVAHDEADDRPPKASRDSLRIVALHPAGPVTHGVPTQFTIRIEATFGSAQEGIARVGFNLDSPKSYRMVGSRPLHEGRQELSLTVKVVPVDWVDRGEFAVMVNMGPKTTAKIWAPTAYVHQTIPVKH